MATITVPFDVLADGYRIEGDINSGYKATVPFLVDWSDAFVFADQVMGVYSASVVGPITYKLPWLFPASVARLYADSFSIAPMGQDGRPLAPTYGLAPGEYFTKAAVTVRFATPPYQQVTVDDPQGLQQLDPENPITLCEQSVKLAGRMRTRKGSGYVYADNTPLAGDLAVPESEARLVLKFPRVPYLPWLKIRSYLGSLNDRPVLGCDTGQLLFEGADSQFTSTTQGLQGQMMVFEFTSLDRDWNEQIRHDNGRYSGVYQKGFALDNTRQIFKYKNLSDLFLEYTVT